MPETTLKTPRKNIEAATTEPLILPENVFDEIELRKLLGKMLALGQIGNVTAAKLYLDYITHNRSDEPAGLTAEEAIKLLAERK